MHTLFLGLMLAVQTITLTWQGPTNDLNGNPIQYVVYHQYGNACSNPNAKYVLMGSATGALTWSQSGEFKSGTVHCYYVTSQYGTSNVTQVAIP